MVANFKQRMVKLKASDLYFVWLYYSFHFGFGQEGLLVAFETLVRILCQGGNVRGFKYFSNLFDQCIGWQLTVNAMPLTYRENWEAISSMAEYH